MTQTLTVHIKCDSEKNYVAVVNEKELFKSQDRSLIENIVKKLTKQ